MISLRPWQAQELANHGMEPKRAIFAAPRLGKTRCIIEHLKLWRPASCLITAPKSVCPFWIDEGASQGITILDAFSGTLKDTTTLIKASPGRFYVVNDDRLAHILQSMPNAQFEALVVDESHRMKTVGSERGRAYRKLAKRAKYVRILTGTPTLNNYGNLWGQMVGLSPDDWFSSFTKFSNRYLICDSMFHNKILGYKNLPELEEKIKKWASIVKREDVFGPDTWQTVERLVHLPAKAAKIYRKLANDWVAEVDGHNVSATHLLTRFTRFHQITSGFMGTENGEVNLHTAKIDALCEDLEEIIESGEKAIIFCQYTWEVETYSKEIKDRLKCQVRIIHGKTSVKDRQEAMSVINHGVVPAVCIVQIQAGGTGISLAGAAHALFVSETFSYVEQRQARDRIYAPGLRKCVTYYRVPNSIDMYIAKHLELKQEIHESVQNLNLKEILFGDM